MYLKEYNDSVFTVLEIIGFCAIVGLVIWSMAGTLADWICHRLSKNDPKLPPPPGWEKYNNPEFDD